MKIIQNDNSLEKEIFRGMSFLTLFVFLLSSILLCVIFYYQLTKYMEASVKSTCEYLSLANSVEIERMLYLIPREMVRVTLVAPSGVVITDNTIPANMLQSHAGREEIKEALLYGIGKSKRFSESLGTITWYYAKKLSTGNVLRISRTSMSLYALFKRAVIFIFLIVFMTLAASYFITGKLAVGIKKLALKIAEISKTEKMRREFSANVSHELKTPLTSISGYAEMLESGMVKETDKPIFIQKIKDESGRLITLIDDIMLLSHLSEAGTEESFEKVDLLILLHRAVENLKYKAEKNGVSINFFGETAVINAHSSMLLQLFVNLIDNAIKYNKEGGAVDITINKAGYHVCVSVTDKGIGIPKDAQQRVFERFYRVDKSRSKKTGGTGLGLAIVKHIAIIHNADITLKSSEGEGTSVTLKFDS